MVTSRDQGTRPQGRPAGRFGGRGRFQQRRKVCAFCADKNIVIDYKDTARLSRYISERAKIDPRRRSGTCARHQRKLAEAIKQARIIALLPFVPEHIRKGGTFWTMSPSVPKAPEAPVEAKTAAVEVKPETSTVPAAPAAEATPAT
ncbi:small subunit ribosomal protein S18 [Dehalogenimonas formicexedens]|uniref:Small ribosomal subunit protein bS18 n=1 Tax=Dehalogenimonas formicexedens TaxID=1839801 RepID=A0A1P8F7G3_9CHLR|nr:30S ribosomal protein S18 [Dehalogenimonas formicexedens]APV44373.1 small subunit ribosomal protein S18 [Dehalogenimonas formicexedens]